MARQPTEEDADRLNDEAATARLEEFDQRSAEMAVSLEASPSPVIAGDREAVARALYERFAERGRSRSTLRESPYSYDVWENLPASFTADFYADADAVLLAPRAPVVSEAPAPVSVDPGVRERVERRMKAGNWQSEDDLRALLAATVR